MMDFAGRVAVVTGAGGGLGSAVAEKYRQAGAIVAAIDHRWPAGLTDLDRLTRIMADLGTEEGARSAIEQTLELGDGPDILAHIAGGFAAGGLSDEGGGNAWERMIQLNLTLAHNVIRAILPAMRKRRYGRIAAVGSRAGVEPVGSLPAYCASKAALHMLIRCMAAEAKDSGITANAVLPSVIDTAANRAAMPRADHSAWVKPEAIADQILWLTSKEAADISGALVPVYGRA